MTADPLALRRFGPSDLQVTGICIGGAILADIPTTFYPVAAERAHAVVRATLDSPINFLDTAADYGDGESERRMGAVLAERGGPPPGFVLATKADRHPQTRVFDGEQTRRSVERSRQLLGMDQLPIVYLHDPEYATTSFAEIMAPGGAVAVLHQLKAAGVIGVVGIAAGPVDMMTRYVESGAFEAMITHNRYTLLKRAADPLIELAHRRGMAVVNAAPYNSGILAKGPAGWSKLAYREAPAQQLERARQMAAICAEHGVPLAAAALQFSTRDPRITSTIVGVSRPERVAQTIELARHPIPAELWSQLDAVGFDTQDL